jgi:hypothetical protein
MFGPGENAITPHDAARVYEILGFAPAQATYEPPTSLNLAAVLEAGRLGDLYEQAEREHRQRGWQNPLGGLTEYRVGVELVQQPPRLRLTEVERGRPNHAGRVHDRSRTIVGTIHTHPWDVSQSIGDVRNLLRSNDLLGGVVTYTGRLLLLVKHPAMLGDSRDPMEQELRLHWSSLRGAPELLRTVGLLGALSASFDLPIQASRDPYIRTLAKRLGLISYTGDVRSVVLFRD